MLPPSASAASARLLPSAPVIPNQPGVDARTGDRLKRGRRRGRSGRLELNEMDYVRRRQPGRTSSRRWTQEDRAAPWLCGLAGDLLQHSVGCGWNEPSLVSCCGMILATTWAKCSYVSGYPKYHTCTTLVINPRSKKRNWWPLMKFKYFLGASQATQGVSSVVSNHPFSLRWLGAVISHWLVINNPLITRC